ncbi:hypothetical protein OC834_004840 [Tilletia horrida]|uniref:Transcriptional coactivator HFI1/ADA1 n=1 Tax=Tilletia horrida TaxID=155126 RepID=A0AAN6G8V3_9BASI|nr:hypothetical protein OC842_006093 [Tilletia horrida]KAK0526318.1 hypothetical protein OC834_004840 [Tilletia horrida]KAK0558909.1 hypothetical protein OC844_004797 [Tilletia horrida]
MVLQPHRLHAAASSSAGPSNSTATSNIGFTRQRIDTLAIKAQLGAALGENQIHYWHALRSFCTAALDRAEFEQLARGYLGKDLIHLHNALIMGILHNASPGVPGPSTDDDPTGTGSSKRRKPGDPDPDATVEVSTHKRQRLVLAGLPKRERQRIKLVGKLSRGPTASAATANTASSALTALGPTLSAASAAGAGAGDSGAGSNADSAALLAGGVGWAGANAEMLERKRKEQEKRKAVEEKRRIRENLTNIGARDWRGETTQQAESLDDVKDKLSASTQSAIARALSASLCIDSKELPDIESLRDRMTLHAVEAGLPGGVHPQAAAMVLLALQGHIQNVIASVIGKLRTRGTGAVISEGSELTAAAAAAAFAAQAEEEDETDDSELHVGRSGALSDIENRPPTQPGSLRRTGSTATLRPMSSSYGENGTLSSPNAKLAAAAAAAAEVVRAHDNTVKLSDMAMLFDLAPQTLVEPLGLGTQERMLAPEYEGNLSLFGSASAAGASSLGFAHTAAHGGRGRPGSSSEDDEDEVAATV